MLRTHKTRPVGGAVILSLTLLASLLVGSIGTAARADGTASPSPSPSPTGTVSGTTTQSSTESSTGTSTPSSTGSSTTTSGLTSKLSSSVQQAVGVPQAVDDTLVIKHGLTEPVNVAANDTCPAAETPTPNDTCTYSFGPIPAGWGQAPNPNGVITIWVPGKTAPGQYVIGYTMTHGALQSSAHLIVDVTPDNYNPPAGMTFSHPYRKGYKYLIRRHVLRTINSVPTGGTIQVASWSFASKSYRLALKAAKSRGVKVQIILSQRNTRKNSDWKLLARIFGTSVNPDGSWVKKCSYSCRGTMGTMHSKLFLFSQAYRTPYVDISGSANLTDFAVTNQWNQMNTVVGNPEVYNDAVQVFNQMSADQPAPYVEKDYPDLRAYYYPRGRASVANDFMMQALAPVRCTGAQNAGRGGRTIIKIAMYAWYQQRGKWLAKRVRQLWNQGCQIQIVFAISSNPVKNILYSPSGRGRIPMRQILLTNTHHVPIYYLHDKWLAITGNYAGNPSASVSLQGSFNFSDLGFASDEVFQLIRGRSVYRRFARDFRLLWTDRQARAPSPISMIPTIEGRYTHRDLRLGTGVYRYMEAD